MPGVSSPSAGSHCVARTTHSSHGLTPELPRNVLRPEKHDTHTKISVNLDTQIHIWIPLLDESMFSAPLPLCPWLAAQLHTHLAAVCRAPARAAGPAAAPCKSSPGDGHPWRLFWPCYPYELFFFSFPWSYSELSNLPQYAGTSCPGVFLSPYCWAFLGSCKLSSLLKSCFFCDIFQ